MSYARDAFRSPELILIVGLMNVSPLRTTAAGGSVFP